MRQFIKLFFLALSFLTILPSVGGENLSSKIKINKIFLFFPFVALILGSILLLFSFLTNSFLPPLPSAVLITILWAVLTGGLHLDGIADTCDGLFSSRNRQRSLEIMKDSHIGTMGVIGLFGILSSKVVLLANLPSPWLPLLSACVLGRWSMVLAASTSSYARPEGGTGADFIQWYPTLLFKSSFWFILFFPFLEGFQMLFFLIISTVLAVFFLRLIFLKKFGGLTGDCLGAICECVEVLVLVLSFLWRVG